MKKILIVFAFLAVTAIHAQDVESKDKIIKNPVLNKIYDKLLLDAEVWVEKYCPKIKNIESYFSADASDELNFDEIEEPLDLIASGVILACLDLYTKANPKKEEDTNRLRRHYKRSYF